MAVYVIGDVQGCYKPLRKLIKLIGFNPTKDRLWFCGDLVNRGPNSADVLRYVMGLGDSAACVLGNHDLNLLAVANGAREIKTSDTLDDVLDADDCNQMLSWLRRRPLFHRSDKHRTCMVHAGIYPSWSINKAETLADEVHRVLCGDDYASFLDNMYGNHPAYWDNTLEGWDRLRFITNVMTRMRYLDTSGAIELEQNCRPGAQSPGFRPWFEVEAKRKPSWTVLFGHWSTLGLHLQNNTICVDSGCLWGGKLTAVRIDTEKPVFYTKNCKQYL